MIHTLAAGEQNARFSTFSSRPFPHRLSPHDHAQIPESMGLVTGITFVVFTILFQFFQYSENGCGRSLCRRRPSDDRLA